MGSHGKSVVPKRPKAVRRRHGVRARSQDSDIILQHPDGDVLRRAILRSDPSSPADLLTLQRLAGNTAVQLLTQPEAVLAQPAVEAEPKDGQLAQRLAVQQTAVTPDSGGLIQRGWFSRAARWVGGRARAAVRGARSLASRAGRGLAGAARRVVAGGTRVFRAVRSGLTTAVTGVAQAGARAYRGIRGGLGRAFNQIRGLGTRAVGGVRGLIGRARDAVSRAGRGVAAFARRAFGGVRGLVRRARGAVTRFGQRVAGLARRAFGGVRSLLGRARGAVTRMAQRVASLARRAFSRVRRWVGRARRAVAGAARTVAGFARRAYARMSRWVRRRLGIVGPPGAVQPTPHGNILGAHQAGRARTAYFRLSSRDQDAFDNLLQRAAAANEQRYLYKALASGHSLAELTTFATRIRGKSAAWMQNNLRLTGSTTGTGVQQQWSHSCNVTTVQAVRGEMDPIYALRIHDENPNFGVVDDADATRQNPRLAAEQQAGLESVYGGTKFGAHSGVAAARGAAGGSGRWADDLLNQMSNATGLTYSTQLVGPDVTAAQARARIDTAADRGMPVPIVIGNGAGQYTHYVLVTGRAAGPPPTYTIHDPWSGRTVTRTQAQMTNGTLNIAGSNQITAIEDPSPRRE